MITHAKICITPSETTYYLISVTELVTCKNHIITWITFTNWTCNVTHNQKLSHRSVHSITVALFSSITKLKNKTLRKMPAVAVAYLFVLFAGTKSLVYLEHWTLSLVFHESLRGESACCSCGSLNGNEWRRLELHYIYRMTQLRWRWWLTVLVGPSAQPVPHPVGRPTPCILRVRILALSRTPLLPDTHLTHLCRTKLVLWTHASAPEINSDHYTVYVDWWSCYYHSSSKWKFLLLQVIRRGKGQRGWSLPTSENDIPISKETGIDLKVGYRDGYPKDWFGGALHNTIGLIDTCLQKSIWNADAWDTL